MRLTADNSDYRAPERIAPQSLMSCAVLLGRDLFSKVIMPEGVFCPAALLDSCLC